MKRLPYLLVTIFMVIALAASPVKKRTKARTPARTVENVNKEKKQTQKKITEAERQIKSNTKQVKKQLNELNTIGAEINKSQEVLSQLNQGLNDIKNRQQSTTDSITSLEQQVAKLQQAYISILRKSQTSTAGLNSMAYIFASKTFSQALARVRALKQFSNWRKRKAYELKNMQASLSRKRDDLSLLHAEAENNVAQQQQETQRLNSNKAEAEKQVKKLESQNTALQKEIEKQKKQARQLDRELDRLIAAEQEKIRKENERKAREKAEAERRAKEKAQKEVPQPPKKGDKTKPAVPEKKTPATQTPAPDAALTGSFTQNKGSLPFPVTSSYKIVKPFGRHAHPTLKGVETENSGIDIQTTGGAGVRTIFEGTVSAIFKQDGFNSIVMVRHGNYISIYAGLGSVAVKQGQKVNARQNLGTLYADPDNNNQGVLHFEIRNEREKLNPTQWVR